MRGHAVLDDDALGGLDGAENLADATERQQGLERWAHVHAGLGRLLEQRDRVLGLDVALGQ